jgi:outer membrane receptor protein involved in Fe transport
MAERRVELGLEAFRLRQYDQLVRLQAAAPGRSVDGLELELAGRPWPGLDLRGGLSLMRANDFLPDDTGVAGIRIPATGVPWGTLHVLGTWQLPQVLQGSTRLTLGYRAQSSKWAVPPVPQFPGVQLNLPGGARLDLSLDRVVGPLTLGVFVRNVFDRQTYGPLSDPRYLPLEPGRSVGLTAVYKGE